MVLILFNSTRVSFTYAYYELDKMGFIENLCENKDKPELQCNGKCHLKKVAESQSKEQKTPESIIDFKELLLYPSPISEFVFTNKIECKKQHFSYYFNLYSFSDIEGCFRPPRVS
ncbi:hypothetical protein EV196_102183 [Mariniflexile fucanivorans]|uniref:Uncharacterized protein n=2 Tax=Mariniflexile fucanivorans TaxID=264023 RepID=A0A4R1RMV2_9FLAO|nr:hypothetical protein EV196_102183 [Mariniflexile fucanivorans]